MTFEEKEKCAQIWEMLTGEKTDANAWCDQAGDTLAEALASIHSCSHAMKHVPRPLSPNISRVECAHIQGIRAEDVVVYLKALITQKMGALGSPEG
ncbi:hypothetical protein [Desulfoluna spongiiphila]|uniref:Uncharacterized protein n=1 Tax=Desulfoluna spongiiphila TaxID=419481 RepID=A0A1G5JBC9_9BACT|nr:hypothetical protein [Desulfoluna spongiiphila]SCY85250.1 hypothetical protein SAMN05216233_1276 [Desulfoluna spongiiphila]VVS94188.1 hypothetical protein DBB_37600 [Desulfoluna spongiiphila]